MKLITATVSLATAFVLIRSLPGAVQLPRILESHRQLQEELPIRRETEAKLLADLRARSFEAAASGRIISPEYILTVPGGSSRTLRMTASAEPHEPGAAPLMVGMFRVF
jgi:hypothetical protein